MTYLIGTDEAGYGPNLGPLLVAASCWKMPAGCTAEQLYARLSEEFASEISGKSDSRLVLADSKALYSSGGTLERIEAPVLGGLRGLNLPISDWHSLWPAVGACTPLEIAAQPWHANFRQSLPLHSSPIALASAQAAFAQASARTGIKLTALQARAIFPQDFNREVDRLGSKGELLSRTTLALVRDCLPPMDATTTGQQMEVLCDKHGGRSKYAALLQHTFPESFPQILTEGRAESAYKFAWGKGTAHIRFLAKGEQILATALASMLAKYLRELAMLAWNQFWQRHLPELRSTAGYPEDAKRFWAETSQIRAKLGLKDDALWRKK